MEVIILKDLNKNIKFPKIIKINDYYLIFGIKNTVMQNLTKFNIFYTIYDKSFSFIRDCDIEYNFEKSTLIWEILEEPLYYIFLIEQKSIDLKKHSTQFYKYYVLKENVERFQVEKIECIALENHLISKIKNNIYFTSKISIDEERPDYYWGKYLFLFYNNNHYQPTFDSMVDYSKDKGHLLHFIKEINKDKTLIVFSIRHKEENKKDSYIYKIYSSYTEDFINFYNTKEIKFYNNITDSKWYCYPECFEENGELFVLINQDDFGKNKKTLLGKFNNAYINSY
jgi:hypothetical protein